MKNWKTTKLKNLAKALLLLKTEKDMLNFLRDIATVEELEDMSSRWQVVQMLQKKLSYREIAKKTGLSTTTVTRIAFWLKHGEGGYKTALAKKTNGVKK